MRSKEIIKEIELLFHAKIIGSYLFLSESYLDYEDINDIDLAIRGDSLGGAVNYLRDSGYINPTGYHFIKEGCKTIQLVPYTKETPLYFDLPTLIKVKFQRSSITDLNQLTKIISRKKEAKLQF